jgi:cellulase
MHNGPAMAYLAPNPGPNTTANELKFFKIYESGFIPSAGKMIKFVMGLSTLTPALDRWANELASDNGDSFKIQLPSDIKPGKYVLRTELIALHGNMKDLKQQALKGQVQIYLHCFNLDIVGSGSATPEGVTFPQAYKGEDLAFRFNPYMSYGIPDPAAAMEHNSKYVSLLGSTCNKSLISLSRSHQGHQNTPASTTCPLAHVQKSKRLVIMPLL